LAKKNEKNVFENFEQVEQAIGSGKSIFLFRWGDGSITSEVTDDIKGTLDVVFSGVDNQAALDGLPTMILLRGRLVPSHRNPYEFP
jgi:hypothetical protein